MPHNLDFVNLFANPVSVTGNGIYFAGEQTNHSSFKNNAAYRPSATTERPPPNASGSGLADSIYVSGSTIYAAGTDTGTSEACYWSGSDPISATATSITGSGVAKSIFVSSGTIYAAGQTGSVACYWTGSSLSASPLSLSASSSIANSICVLSGTIYIAGQIGGATATYWTVTGGTVSSPVSLSSSNAQANSIFVP